MYGIVFRGNADLRPILLYEGFVGHPLRKDYPKQHEQPLVPYRDSDDADARDITLPNPVRPAFEPAERDGRRSSSTSARRTRPRTARSR